MTRMVTPDERLREGEPVHGAERAGWWPPRTRAEQAHTRRINTHERVGRTQEESAAAAGCSRQGVATCERRALERVGMDLAAMGVVEVAARAGVSKQRVSQVDAKVRRMLADSVGSPPDYTGPAAMWAVVASERLLIVKAEGVLEAIAAAVVEFGESHRTLTARRMAPDEVIVEGRSGGFAAAYAARKGEIVLVEDKIRGWA